ncbi:MAG: amidophosphoribosyltransferase [Candidatus Micrarchaeota archaeon]|nr:amidophosphoribosyltransferase [Candidatus Micrarchaeota archaeon]
MVTSYPRSDDAPREYCGAFGIYSFSGKDVAGDIYFGLMNLQHRGQDSAGASVSDGKRMRTVRGLGFVPEVLPESAIASLTGHVGIGHVRYPTIGAGGEEDAQPFMAEVAGKKFALAHNGNISNYGRARKMMEDGGASFCSTCDAELILAAYAKEYRKTPDFFEAARALMQTLDGSYSVVCITDSGELIAFRDPHSIRPLCWGADKDRIVFASESVALDIIKCPLTGDVAPGEVIVVSKDGVKRKVVAGGKPRHCMFEYVYFSRPDSRIDGKWVYEVRHNLGRQLARAAPVKADFVVAVPDTARSAVEGYSQESGIPVAEGLIKNRYIGRTFIMPSQKKREDAVRIKLNAVKHVVDGKRVVLIDDSIVRGTTMGPIVKLVRDAGAKEIHLRITCPPIMAPCFYGVDIPTYKELIATRKSVEEIRKAIGADSLVYQTMDGLVSSIGMKKEELCTGCLDEQYPTEFGMEISRMMKAAGSRDGIRAWEEKE